MKNSFIFFIRMRCSVFSSAIFPSFLFKKGKVLHPWKSSFFEENIHTSGKILWLRKTLTSVEMFLEYRLWHRCFPVNFAKFLGTPFLQNTSGRLILYIVAKNVFWVHILSLFFPFLCSNHFTCLWKKDLGWHLIRLCFVSSLFIRTNF